MKYAIFGVFFSLILIGTQAHAVCLRPDGVEGELIYNKDSNKPQYCDGTSWIGVGWKGAPGASPAGNAGEIQFNSGSGKLAADSGLFWNSTTKRLGIGTATPTANLHITSDSTNSTYVKIGNSAPSGQDWSLYSSGGGPAVAGTFGIYQESAGASRLLITPTGNVGIGVTSPVSQLDLGNSYFTGTPATTKALANKIALWNSGDANHYGIGISTTALNLVAGETGGTIRFHTGGANERMRINAIGNIGIGVTSPSYRMHVAGVVAGGGAYVNTSDRRLKKDIAILPYGLSTINALRPIAFQWKSQDESWQKGRKIGLIAQEVEQIVPEVVSTAADADGTKSIAYGDLVPVLIKAVQELKVENENLSTELKEIKAAIGLH